MLIAEIEIVGYQHLAVLASKADDDFISSVRYTDG